MLLAINSADDERNPPELGVLDREIKQVKNGRVLLIPAGDNTLVTARLAAQCSGNGNWVSCCRARRVEVNDSRTRSRTPH